MKSKFCLIFCLFIFTLKLSSYGQVRVEPPNWWTEMKTNSIELLLHGNNIGNLMPEISYSGVVVRNVARAESPNYIFLELEIAPNTKPGELNILLKRGSRTIHSVPYTLLERSFQPEDFEGFNSSDVVLLVTPDRFSNGDPTNDIIEGMNETTINREHDYARHGGDIRGFINHLDYWQNMGFTAIWPNPLLENNMKQWSYHGYAITDFYKVDPRFGTLDEYKELATKARAKGIKLIMDVVVNHSGNLHWWMEDLPFSNWINYQDSLRITNHRRTVNQDIYASTSDRELNSQGWFVPSMPDLNQNNPHMAKYIIQNSIWWIETLGLGGIRNDTYPYAEKEFLKNWTCTIMEEYPNFNIVGEEWSTNPLTIASWQKGYKGEISLGGCLRTIMDFPMQQNLVEALTEEEGWGSGIIKLYNGLSNDFIYHNPLDILTLLDNHDMDRIHTQLNKDMYLTQMAIAWIATTRGIPQILYGTEILMENSAKRGDHGLIRSDFPGGWEGDAINAFDGTGLKPAQKAMQQFTKDLLNWRKNKEVIHTGKTLHFAPEDGTYVYFRYNENETVMVVMNKGSNKQLDLQRFSEILHGKSTATNVLSDEAFSLSEPLPVPGKTALILEIK